MAGGAEEVVAPSGPSDRGWAFVLHLATHPEDEPALADVTVRRVSGTAHPATRRPDLVARVAAVVVAGDPTWAREGRVDATVERVLDLVELLEDVEVRRL